MTDPQDIPVPNPPLNLNLAFAQRRRNNRPRTRNQPRNRTQEYDLKWVEPIQNVDPQPQKFVPNAIDDFIGEIDLNPDLPERIGNGPSEVFYAVSQGIAMADNVARSISEDMVAQSYFKCAKQLFSSLVDSDKSNCQPLKGVFYDTTPLPKSMNVPISMIGNFETKFGDVRVKYATVLFRR